MIGTLLTILCPVLGLPVGLYGLLKYKRKKLCYIFCIALFFASIAYSALPRGDNDLTRYWVIVEALGRKASLLDALQQSNYAQSGVYGFVAYAWLIGRIGDLNLLQYFPTFTVYFTAIYFTCKVADDTNVGKRTFFSYLFFMIISLNLYGIICNVRNVFGFSLISLAVFRDVYQKKRNFFTLILYIASVFMHNSVILLFVIRLLLIKPFSKSRALPVFILLIPPLSEILYNLFYEQINPNNIISTLIKNSIRKAYNYFSAETESYGNEWAVSQYQSVTGMMHRISYVMLAVILLLILFLIVKPSISKYKRRKDDTNLNNLIKSNIILYVEYLCFLTLAFATMIAPEYWRIATAVISLGSVIVITARALLDKNNVVYNGSVLMNNFNVLFLIYGIFSGFCLIMWFRSFRIFDLSYMASHLFFTSPILIFARLL